MYVRTTTAKGYRCYSNSYFVIHTTRGEFPQVKWSMRKAGQIASRVEGIELYEEWLDWVIEEEGLVGLRSDEVLSKGSLGVWLELATRVESDWDGDWEEISREEAVVRSEESLVKEGKSYVERGLRFFYEA
jgi:hypothetical protein